MHRNVPHNKSQNRCFKMVQQGTQNNTSHTSKGPDPMRNAGLAMPLHETAKKLPLDYIPVKYRRRFNEILARMLDGMKNKAKWSHLFRHKALMQAMKEIDAPKKPVVFKPEPPKLGSFDMFNGVTPTH